MIPKLLNDALGFNIDRIATLLRRELIRELAVYDLTPEQWQIMVTLWYSDYALTQSDIVKMTFRDKHSISRMIIKLEKKGWIEKAKGEKDARQTYIKKKKKGDSFKDEIPAHVKKGMSKKFNVLDSSEKKHLKSIIRKLRSSLEMNQ